MKVINGISSAFKKFTRNRLIISILGMILGTTIYCFSLVFVLKAGEVQFYAGGVTGMSQILANIITPNPEQTELNGILTGIFIAAGNTPLFLLGWKSVSKKFAFLSLASVLLQSALTILFTQFKTNFGFNPLADLANKNMLAIALIGGILCGAGCAIPLRSGASTGGMDIVSQTFTFKFGIPFTVISGSVDFLVITSGAIVGKNIEIAIYTIVRLIVHLITLDKIHTIYKFQKVTIITDKHDELQKELISHFPHGVTIYKATGGFTNTDKWVLESVVFTYELEQYREIIKKVDDKAFVYYTSIKGIMGKFVRRAI